MIFPKSLTIPSPVRGILNHWTAREVLALRYFKFKVTKSDSSLLKSPRSATLLLEGVMAPSSFTWLMSEIQQLPLPPSPLSLP